MDIVENAGGALGKIDLFRGGVLPVVVKMRLEML